jgi:inosose dehydratase
LAAQTPWQRFLDLANNAAFDGVELGTWGYLPQDAQRLRKELEARELDLAAGALIAGHDPHSDQLFASSDA